VIADKEKLTELPVGWVLSSLGDVAELQSGNGFPKKYQGKSCGEIPFYKVADISRALKNGTFHLQTAQNYVSKRECKEMKGKPLKAGSIVFAKIGEAIRLNRRAILCEDSLVDNNGMGLRSILPDMQLYLYYFMLTIKLGDYSRATTVPSVRKGDVEQILLPLPPVPEQKRIVAKIEELFTKLDAGVEALKKVRQELKRYRQAVLKHAFEGKLTAEWREKNKDKLEPASKLLERIAKEREKSTKGKKQKKLLPLDTSSLPALPEDWAWARLAAVALVASGQTPKGLKGIGSQGAIPFYKVGDMNRTGNETYMRESEVTVSLEEASSLRLHIRDKGTVIFPKRGGAIKTNKKRILTKPSTYDLNTMGVLLYVMPSKYFYYWISAFDLASISDGSNVPQINHTDVEPIAFPIAPLEEQHEIVNEVERHLSITDEIEQAIEQGLKQSDRLRQSILKKAFEGKLVPQDPDDEPAEKLLERIKTESAEIQACQKRDQCRNSEIQTPLETTDRFHESLLQ